MTKPDVADWVRDERMLSVGQARSEPHAQCLTLEEALALLVSPDSGLPLALEHGASRLVDGESHRYPYHDPLPILVPKRLQQYFSDCLRVPPDCADDAFLQYFLLSCIKQSGQAGPVNASPEDIHYRRHLFRMRNLLRIAQGRVLDVGCDDPLVGCALLPPSTRYLGLDPFCRRREPFRIVGFAEFLPFANEVFQGVVFNTSLDHILDWRRAIDEALRVLVPGGDLFVSTLVWSAAAGLLSDAVHFHHFREYEILGALHGLQVTQELHYDYKGASHRHGLYLSIKKPSRPAT